MLQHLKRHLLGKAVILGIGNKLRCDDGIGSILADRIKDKVPYIVYDVEESPENYLEKIIKDNPDNILIIDAVDFDGKPGEFKVLGAQDLKTSNLFFTHNASLSLAINYLQTRLKADIIILIIQPKLIAFGESLSPEISDTLQKLEDFFYETAKEKG